MGKIDIRRLIDRFYEPQSEEKSASSMRWILYVGFYTAIANIPYWLAVGEFGFLSHRGLFCVQFLTVGVIALFVPRILAAILLLLAMLADLISCACESYTLSPAECFANFGVYSSISRARQFEAFAIIALVFVIAAGSALLPTITVRRSERWHVAVSLVALWIVMISSDVVTIRLESGRFPNVTHLKTAEDVVHTRWLGVPRFARVSVLRLIRQQAFRNTSFAIHAASTNGEPVLSATGVAKNWSTFVSSPGPQPPNVVLVMVESWGLSTNQPLQNALVQPYAQPALRERYQVLQGTVPFSGGTIDGESRELCGKALGAHLMTASPDELRDCLPAQLSALGYRNIALHGMDGGMYHRSSWYRTIGFDEIRFRDEFRAQGLPNCPGAFVGTCDADVAKWIGGRLAQDDRQPIFIHWMTLNSHLPAFVPSPLLNGAPCLASISLSNDTPLCTWYQLVVNVHQSVADIALGDRSRPTILIVVGDHAPPFSDPDLRGQFSNLEVPYVVLVPRTPHPAAPDRILARSTPVLSGKASPSTAQVP